MQTAVVTPSVIPAKAAAFGRFFWIPVFAGMTSLRQPKMKL